jgi:sugar phosphate isomerase/epimerase
VAERALQIGVVAGALSNDLREAARQARIAGFGGVQLDVVSGALDVTTLSQTGRREVRSVLSSNDQQLIGLRADLGPKGLSPSADIDRVLARLQQILEAAKGLSAPLVCLEMSLLPPAPNLVKPSPNLTAEQAGLLIIPSSSPPPPPAISAPPPDPALVSSVDTALGALGVIADRIGVTIAFRSELASFGALERALATAACAWFGVDFDPVGVLRDEWPLDEILSRLGPLIRHVRGRDALAGAERRTKPAPIGQGSTDWPALLGALDSAGYRGWLTVDPLELPDRAAGAVAALKFLSRS